MSTVPYDELRKKFEDEGQSLIIKDSARIEECLKALNYSPEGSYVVGVFYKNNENVEIQGFSKENVPVFIKQYFE